MQWTPFAEVNILIPSAVKGREKSYRTWFILFLSRYLNRSDESFSKGPFLSDSYKEKPKWLIEM